MLDVLPLSHIDRQMHTFRDLLFIYGRLYVILNDIFFVTNDS